VSVTWLGIFEAESLFDNATALSIASLVGSSGGLLDLSVKESEGPSCANVGVNERVCRSRSVPSLVCVRAEDGSNSSVWWRPDVIPDQSPDIGLEFENSGEADSGVKAP
jgi:hypothetical protein